MLTQDFSSLLTAIEAAALDSGRWPDVLDMVSQSAGATGAALISTEKRFRGPPFSPSLEDLMDRYFRDDWSERDSRYRGVPSMLRGGVARDQDYATPEEFQRSPYYQEFHGRLGFRWSACIGFQAGDDLWCVALQRKIAQGPFEPDEARALSKLRRALADAATLSRQLGFARVIGMVDGLDHVAQPALAFDARGKIIAHNGAAEAQFGVLFEKRLGSLAFYDRRSQARFETLLATATADPLVGAEGAAAASALDRYGRAAQLRAVTLHDWGRFAFTGARVLLLAKRVDPGPRAPPLWSFGLTPAEARLTGEIVAGVSLADAAAKTGIAYQTARTQLKSVFAKTGVRRQAELVALLTGGKTPQANST